MTEEQDDEGPCCSIAKLIALLLLPKMVPYSVCCARFCGRVQLGLCLLVINGQEGQKMTKERIKDFSSVTSSTPFIYLSPSHTAPDVAKGVDRRVERGNDSLIIIICPTFRAIKINQAPAKDECHPRQATAKEHIFKSIIYPKVQFPHLTQDALRTPS